MVTNFIFNTAFGYIGITYLNKGISKLNLPVASYEEACRTLGTPATTSRQPTQQVANIVERIKMYFNGKKVDFPGDFEISGTAFQRKVWDAARRIPYGETMTYSQIAAKIGNPKAVRAVGNALGKNPLPIIIPCHRVLAKGGGMGGFAGGIEMKKRLLELEYRSH